VSEFVDEFSSSFFISLFFSVGSNPHPRSGLRPVVIDGSNVAMSHGRHMNVFSVKGIKMVVEFFKARGHKNVIAFLPEYRKKNRFSNDPVSFFSVLRHSRSVFFGWLLPALKPAAKMFFQCFTSKSV
jgi:hypothetical protein